MPLLSLLFKIYWELMSDLKNFSHNDDIYILDLLKNAIIHY